MLPLNTTDSGIKGLFRFQTKAVSHAVQFLPVIGEWQGTGTSATSIMVSPRGHPVLFGLYDSPTNYNFNLIAESGAGKSFATQSFIADFLAEGARVWVIDKGYSYKKLCAAVGGEYIQFSDESGLCLNPFTHITVIDDEMDLLKAMLSKMAAPKDGIDDYQMSILAQAIKGVWAHYGNQSSITAVADWCLSQKDRRAQDIGTQLFEFTRHGSYGHWFDGDNNLQFHKRFVVLELEELSARSHLQQVVLLQLISKVNQEMYLAQLNEKGRKKLLIVDEAKDLIDDPVMSKALESAGSRVRKYEGALGIVTQSIANLYRSPSGRVIAENSAFNIVMMQKSESIDAAIAEKHFKIDAYGEWRLRALHTVPGRYAEMMIKRGDDYGVVRLVTDRFSQVLFSSKGAERNEILDAIDRGEDVVKVIDQFIQERG
jgi:conjugal transfer ATP-binding protein TraC